MKRGLIHIYTGDGKGKTTAATGLCLRALGAGYSVAVFQFMKASPSGEMAYLQRLDHVTVRRAECPSSKFVWDMNDTEKRAYFACQQALFDDACEAVTEGRADVIVLDEIFGAIECGALDADEVKYLMAHKNRVSELILTGRHAPKSLYPEADYVTEMTAVRHPHDRGVDARRGIEF